MDTFCLILGLRLNSVNRNKSFFYKELLKWTMNKGSSPANIYLFKVAIETLEKGVKYVQR